MLDCFVIFTQGGLVLWSLVSEGTEFIPAVNAFIHSVLLEQKTGGTTVFSVGDQAVRWALDNQ
jgi:hypothetical protein